MHRYSKLQRVVSTSRTIGMDVANFLSDHCLTIYGITSSFLAHNEAHLESKFLAIVCVSFCIKHHTTVWYHFQMGDQDQWCNKTILTHTRQCVVGQIKIGAFIFSRRWYPYHTQIHSSVVEKSFSILISRCPPEFTLWQSGNVFPAYGNAKTISASTAIHTGNVFCNLQAETNATSSSAPQRCT